MTIRKKKSWLDHLLKRFGYHRHAKLPDNFQQIRDRFGPYVQITMQGDLMPNTILAELALIADKIKTVTLLIEGFNELTEKEIEVATAGLASILADLSVKVAQIHAAYERQCWSEEKD